MEKVCKKGADLLHVNDNRRLPVALWVEKVSNN
jgi:hypothetical protein